MISFFNNTNNFEFSINDVEIEVLMPIFISFNKKTGLKIDEFGDIRLLVDNLLLIKNISTEYLKQERTLSNKNIIMKFINNINKIVTEGSFIYVSGE